MASYEWPAVGGSGGGGGVTVYANFAAFPVTATIGDLGVAADTGIVYEWRGSSWEQIAAPSGYMFSDMSNMASPTAASQDLIFDTGFTAYVKTDDSSSATAKSLVLEGGSSTLGSGGGLQVSGGNGTVNGGDVGIFAGGSTVSGNGGSLALSSGAKAGAGTAGNLSLQIATGGKFRLFEIAGTTPVVGQSLVCTNADGSAYWGVPISLAAFGASPNANGLTLTGSALNLQPADATHPGGLLAADWNTFNNKQAALTIGNLSDVGTDGIVVTGGAGSVIGSGTSIAQHVADASHNGYLSSTDWTTFNGKQAALTIGNLSDVGTDGIVVTNGAGSVIGSGTSIAQHVADASHNGYLASGDWSTFNSKQATVSIGALDAQAENATGLALVSGVLSAQSADSTHPGMVNTSAQTFAGAKTMAADLITNTNIVTTATSSSSIGNIMVGATRWIHNFGTNNLFIGQGAGNYTLTTATAVENVVLGDAAGTAFTAGTANVLIGKGAGSSISSGSKNTVIGWTANTNATTTRVVVIGSNSGATANDVVAIGESASSGVANSIVFGSNSSKLSDMYIGKGITNATPAAVSFNANGASGSNAAGADIAINAGPGTGSGVSGKVLFKTASNVAAASTLNTLVSRGGWDTTGGFFINGTTSGTLTTLASAATTSYSLTYPALQGPIGSMMKNDGTGVLSWAPPAAKNYIYYGSFENNATTGWSLGTVGTMTNNIPTGTPTFGSGASGNLSIATVSSGQLAGTYSLSLVSSAATTSGDMLASQSYAIDLEDQAKVLTFKFYYSAISGATNCNFSGTSSNSFGIAIWDVTNSSWLTSTANFGMVQGTGVGYVTGTCQTNATTANLRFVVYNANATAGATSINFDDFFLGPQTAPLGAAMTDFTAFTPTGSWSTNTTYTGWWKRTGDNLTMIVKVALAGAPTSASLTVNLPSGLTIDTTKLPVTPTNQVLGQVTGSAAAHNFSGIAFYSSTTAVGLFYTSDGNTASIMSYNPITQAAPYTFANADAVFAYIDNIPISGWSSNTVMSNDTDTRVVALAVKKSGTQAVTANVTNITFTSTVFQDTHGGWNGTETYTIPVAGTYWIGSDLADNSSNSYQFFVYINGTTTGYAMCSSAAGFPTGGGALYAGLKPGDLITIRANATQTVGTPGVLSLFRLSGPATIAATESVNARYFSSSSSLSGSLGNVTYATKDFDSHNAMSGATYTIPVSGKYQVNASIIMTATTTAANNLIQLQINKNGSAYSGPNDSYFTSATSKPMTLVIGDIVNCLAGDTITVQASNAGSTPSITSSNSANYISIARVGN